MYFDFESKFVSLPMKRDMHIKYRSHNNIEARVTKTELYTNPMTLQIYIVIGHKSICKLVCLYITPN